MLPLVPVYRKQFHKDIKLMIKRGKAIEKIKNIIEALCSQSQLAARYQDHPLRGEYSDCRECHIEPDWLLVYRIAGAHIFFLRTGSHSDLF